MTNADEEPQLLVCDCQRSMEIDGGKLASAMKRGQPIAVHTELCGAGLEAFEKALAAGRPLHVACTHQAALFSELAEEKGTDTELFFTNIRETAGWCEKKSAANAKMAALLASAAAETKPTGLTGLESHGVCLVLGAGQLALDAAEQLSGRLSVSLLLTDASDAMPPARITQPIAKGRVKAARGVLGAFDIVVDGYAPMLPSSRASLEFVMPRDGVSSKCDLILDLTGDAPLLTGPAHRDGYVRVDPGDPAAVARAMLKLTDMVGEFEKPIYVKFDAAICAHARSGITGCTNCLDSCPAGAITPDGDVVSIDAKICGGCGNCSSVCPTGAVEYAYLQREDLLERAKVMLGVYRDAGGKRPALLLHDEREGGDVIAALARYSRGLPTNVLPLGLHASTRLGHVDMAAMLALGANHIVLLASPDRAEELASLQQQADLANAFVDALQLGGPRVTMIADRDPDVLEEVVYGLEELDALGAEAFALAGTKRDIARTSFAKLHAAAQSAPEIIELPDGAPYGRIAIDTKRCTLCLACVGACPANALADSPEQPEVAFTEAACVQCGICASTCPEKVITLEPRYNFASSALTPDVLNAEEPFHCVRCGEPFGAKATVERVVERLKGHSMFPDEKQLQLIQMCDNCRVIALAESENDPFKGGERPKVRTTDDYLAAEAAAKKKDKTPDDFLS